MQKFGILRISQVSKQFVLTCMQHAKFRKSHKQYSFLQECSQFILSETAHQERIASCKNEKKKDLSFRTDLLGRGHDPPAKHTDAACLPGLQTFGPFSSHCANAPTQSISKSLPYFTWHILYFATSKKICQVKKEFISNSLA